MAPATGGTGTSATGGSWVVGGTPGSGGTYVGGSAGSGGTSRGGGKGSGGNAGASGGFTVFASGGVPPSGGTASVGGTIGSGGTFSTNTGRASPSDGGTAGSSRGGSSSSTLHTCDRSAGPPAFGARVSLGLPNTALSEIDPVVTRDGLRLYFVRYQSSTTGNDIYMSTRSSTSVGFGAGTVLVAASTNSNETHFFESANGLEAFLSSDRTGTRGGADIFRATRLSTADPWGTFAPLANVNSTGGDFDPHLECVPARYLLRSAFPDIGCGSDQALDVPTLEAEGHPITPLARAWAATLARETSERLCPGPRSNNSRTQSRRCHAPMTGEAY